MNNYKNLEVWKHTLQLTIDIYTMTKTFPKEEQFCLTPQIRRSVTAVVSNIAEGCGRNTRRDFDHFLAMAMGSSFELDTQCRIAMLLGYVRSDDAEQLFDKIDKAQKMIFKLKKSILNSL